MRAFRSGTESQSKQQQHSHAPISSLATARRDPHTCTELIKSVIVINILYRTQEQQSKVRACRSAASPHTAGHDAHVGGLTWRPALSVIHPAPSYPGRIRGVCEGASGAVQQVQAQARLWQADLRRFS
jgi:hypothetical protein